MITKIELQDWKSFKETTMYIDPLSIIIGKNASGKSNVLDALQFVQYISSGQPISDAVNTVRGGADWLIRKGEKECAVRITMGDESGATEYVYAISICRKDKSFYISSESLKRIIRKRYKRIIFETCGDNTMNVPMTSARIYAARKGRQKRMNFNLTTSVLSQIEFINVVKDVKTAVSCVLQDLRNIFVLSPDPQKMHNFIPLSESLSPDGANVAGVLAGMSDEERQIVEQQITKFVEKLPERDIQRVWTEKVGMFDSYAMLNCEEEWTPGNSLALDARGMSDGTLRFIAIAVALLTRPQGSLLVIDEIDNGLHPSRSKQLIDMLMSIGEERQIDILCTTHNPILVNTLGIQMIPFISFVRRNEENAYSEIVLLEDLPNLAKLLAAGNIGELMAQNIL